MNFREKWEIKMNLAKKIGIITLFGYFNYGNRLQNYALQEAIKELGFEVETIVIGRNSETTLMLKEKSLKLEKKIVNWNKKRSKAIPCFMKKRFEKIIKKINIHINKKHRDELFRIFSDKFLNERFINYSEKRMKKIQSEYDYFVTGSDQVWNPHFFHGMGEAYFLTFADKKKRISYAPSFGLEKIPLKYQEKYKNWLLNMEKLSVREVAGKKIIKELTGRDAKMVLDPTLLITKEKWLEIASPAPNKPKEKFLVTYFLGEVSSKTKEEILGVAEKKGLKIINLGDKKEKENFKNGPSEFVDYLNSAEVIFTDSFHGTVFSILLEKPFVVYKRSGKSSMYSRIETLMDLFSLHAHEAENVQNYEKIFAVDFSHTKEILEAKRKEASAYLATSFQVESEKSF
jgi:hypothetical protein